MLTLGQFRSSKCQICPAEVGNQISQLRNMIKIENFLNETGDILFLSCYPIRKIWKNLSSMTGMSKTLYLSRVKQLHF